MLFPGLVFVLAKLTEVYLLFTLSTLPINNRLVEVCTVRKADTEMKPDAVERVPPLYLHNRSLDNDTVRAVEREEDECNNQIEVEFVGGKQAMDYTARGGGR